MPTTLTPPATRVPRTRSRLAILAGVGLILLGASLWVPAWLERPPVPLLVPRAGAQWVVAPEPLRLERRKGGTRTTRFRAALAAPEGGTRGTLQVVAFGEASVEIDGRAMPAQPLEGPGRGPLREQTITLALPPDGASREIVITVRNDGAPPALLVHGEPPVTRTGAVGWEAEGRDGAWHPAALAAAPRRPETSARFPTSLEALARTWPLVIAAFALGAAGAWAAARGVGPRWLREGGPSPCALRWGLLWLWALLGANNLLKIPAGIGFDARGHLEYIRLACVADSLPLATDGWQMFQSPLYYLLSAPLHLALERHVSPALLLRILTLIPLLAALAQVEVCYLAGRAVFRGSPALQRALLLIGGLLPAGLYMSASLGNETLCALLSGIVLLRAFDIASRPRGTPISSALVTTGVFLGLALLAKVTAALLVPILLLALTLRPREAGASAGEAALPARGAAREVLASVALLLAPALVIAGWYYARNWALLGSPFVGGWDAARGIAWWQDPGYRTPSELLRFGEAVRQPIFAAAAGLWDGLYSTLWADGYLSGRIRFEGRPPWNYDLVATTALLSLLPAAAILAGVARTALERDAPWRRAGLIAAAFLAVLLAALAKLYLEAPVYSTAKASYTLGATAAYGILGALGMELLWRRPALRPLAVGGLLAWAVCAYGGYFVL